MKQPVVQTRSVYNNKSNLSLITRYHKFLGGIFILQLKWGIKYLPFFSLSHQVVLNSSDCLESYSDSILLGWPVTVVYLRQVPAKLLMIMVNWWFGVFDLVGITLEKDSYLEALPGDPKQAISNLTAVTDDC